MAHSMVLVRVMKRPTAPGTFTISKENSAFPGPSFASSTFLRCNADNFPVTGTDACCRALPVSPSAADGAGASVLDDDASTQCRIRAKDLVKRDVRSCALDFRNTRLACLEPT